MLSCVTSQRSVGSHQLCTTWVFQALWDLLADDFVGISCTLHYILLGEPMLMLPWSLQLHMTTISCMFPSQLDLIFALVAHLGTDF